MKASEVNNLKTGTRVKIKSIMFDREKEATVAECEGIVDKFFELDNGEEIFSFEVEEMEFLTDKNNIQ